MGATLSEKGLSSKSKQAPPGINEQIKPNANRPHAGQLI
jgi:hypothetical protein